MQTRFLPGVWFSIIAIGWLLMTARGLTKEKQERNFSLTVGGTGVCEGRTDVVYTWGRTALERTLAIDRPAISVSSMTYGFNRDLFYVVPGDHEIRKQGTEISAETREELAAFFGVPYLRIQLDAQGKETSRNRVGGHSFYAGLVEDYGLMNDVALMQPAAPSEKEIWEREAAVDVGAGEKVKGTLTYTRLSQGWYGVAGTLTSEQAGYMRELRYQVSGAQYYDAKEKEWTQGTLKMAVSFYVGRNRALGPFTGEVVYKLETQKK